MAGIETLVLPLALGGALVAGISYGDVRRRPTGSRRTRRGARWARRRELRTVAFRPDAPPSGRLALGRLPGRVSATTVAAEAAQSLVVVGPDPEREDNVPGVAGHSGLARTRGGGQRQGRPCTRLSSRPHASRAGVVHRSHGEHRLAGQQLVPVVGLRRLASGLPGGLRSLRDGEGRRDDGRWRVLVRHGGQVPGAAPPGRGPRSPHHGRRRAVGRHAGGD